MTWLRHGVPVALLADLVEPDGPRSREIYAAEAAYDDVQRDTQSLEQTALEAHRCTTTSAADQDFSAARTA